MTSTVAQQLTTAAEAGVSAPGEVWLPNVAAIMRISKIKSGSGFDGSKRA